MRSVSPTPCLCPVSKKGPAKSPALRITFHSSYAVRLLVFAVALVTQRTLERCELVSRTHVGSELVVHRVAAPVGAGLGVARGRGVRVLIGAGVNHVAGGVGCHR